jgi:hypothetical protein
MNRLSRFAIGTSAAAVLLWGGMADTSWAEGAGEAAGTLGKGKEELKRLGSQAAEQAKKAGEAAQKAEDLANKLSGTEQKEAQHAAHEARQRADKAQSNADRLQQQSAHAEGTPNLEEARKAESETKSMKEQAEGQANKALEGAVGRGLKD